MKSAAWILGLVLLLIGCKPSVMIELDPVTGHTTTFEVDKKTKAYHGEFTKVDSLGVVLEKGHYVNGQLHGVRELYYPDGTVKVRERYVRDTLDDLYEYFLPDGQLELHGYYVDGAMCGLWRKYAPEGHLVEKVIMNQNEEHGPFTEYYADGTIQTEGTYLHGPKEEGTLKFYDPNGDLYKTMLCRQGRCVTTWEKP